MRINRVDIVSDGMAVVFSNGEAWYLAGNALHANLDLLGACTLTLGDPSPIESSPLLEPQKLVKLLVGRDEMFGL